MFACNCLKTIPWLWLWLRLWRWRWSMTIVLAFCFNHITMGNKDGSLQSHSYLLPCHLNGIVSLYSLYSSMSSWRWIRHQTSSSKLFFPCFFFLRFSSWFLFNIESNRIENKRSLLFLATCIHILVKTS